jgi:hypothetical protein
VTGLDGIGRWLIVAGLVLAVVGVVLVLGPRVPLIGRLPGDIRIERDGFTFFAPLGTMLVISIVLTVLLNLFSRR